MFVFYILLCVVIAGISFVISIAEYESYLHLKGEQEEGHSGNKRRAKFAFVVFLLSPIIPLLLPFIIPVLILGFMLFVVKHTVRLFGPEDFSLRQWIVKMLKED